MIKISDAFQEFSQLGRGKKILPAEIIWIFSKVFRTSPDKIFLNFDRRITPAQYQQLKTIRTKIQQDIPLDYLLGEAEFMGIKLKVAPGVFIPRPETELLVEQVIKNYSDVSGKNFSILDVGTGTGNIAIALASFLPEAFVWAVEKSPVARAIARKNIQANHLTKRIKLLSLDIEKSAVRLPGKYFDIIVSNPPYVPTGYVKNNRFEPALALDGGKDGQKFYYSLARLSRRCLKPGGKIFLEIGHNQAGPVKNIFQRAGFSEVKVMRDYNGRDRILTGCWTGVSNGKNYY